MTPTDIVWRTGPYYDAMGVKICDAMKMIEASQAEARANWLRSEGLWQEPAEEAVPAGCVSIAGFQEHIKTTVAWPSVASSFREVLAIAPLRCVPELADKIAVDDCLQEGGLPYLVLGETRVVSVLTSGAIGLLADGYVAKPYYHLDGVLAWTRHLRAAQIEEEFRARGPGQQHRELSRQIEELRKARGGQ
jgi:hypothetical protein